MQKVTFGLEFLSFSFSTIGMYLVQFRICWQQSRSSFQYNWEYINWFTLSSLCSTSSFLKKQVRSTNFGLSGNWNFPQFLLVKFAGILDTSLFVTLMIFLGDVINCLLFFISKGIIIACNKSRTKHLWLNIRWFEFQTSGWLFFVSITSWIKTHPRLTGYFAIYTLLIQNFIYSKTGLT